ncbi:MAG TPA: SPFH domain-containing protein, partial [Agriterribacter sp.]|nr:SPFH domain-containing protein [Agriterribacter sp.]
MTDFDQQVAYYRYLAKKHGRKILLGLFVLILLLTSVRTVGPEEEGVVLNLGQYSRTVNPGLNFIAPFGIEKMYKIPVQRQLKHEFGFRTTGIGSRSQYSDSDFSIESSMLSGDLNMADVEWVVQYRIENSFQYLFRVKDPERSLR